MGGDATQDIGAAMEARLGAVDYRLQIPALSFGSYMRMNRVLLRQPNTGRPPRIGWSLLRSLVLCLALGSVIGMLTVANELTAGLWFGFDGTDIGWQLSGGGLMFLVLLIMALTAVLGMLYLNRIQRGMFLRIHAAAGELYGAHELLIAERGLVVRNVARANFVPWSAVTRVARDQELTLIVADHVSAFWLTESVLAELPDRAAFMACLERHMMAHPRADRRPT